MWREMSTDAVIRYAALALVAVLPAFFLPFSWVTFAQAKILFVALAALVVVSALCVNAYRTRRLTVPRSRILWAYMFVVVAYGVATLMSIYPAGSFAVGSGEGSTLAAIVLMGAAMYLGMLVSGDARIRTDLFRAFLVGAVAAIVLFALKVALPQLIPGILGATPVGTSHDFAVYLGFVALSALFFSDLIGWSDAWRNLAYGFWATAALILMYENAPDVWFALALIAAGTAYSEWSVEQYVRGTPRVLWLKAGAAALALFLAVAGSSLSTVLPLQNVHDPRPSLSETLATGAGAYEDPKQALFGSGPYSFARDWALYRPQSANRGPSWDTDYGAGTGFVPTAFIEAGLVGALAWVAFLAFLLRDLAGLVRDRRKADETMQFLTAGVLYLLFFHIVSAPAFALGVFMFFCVGILIRGPVATWHIQGRTAAAVKTAAVALCAICVFVSAGGELRATVSQALVNRGIVHYNATGDYDGSLASVRAALYVDPGNARAERAAAQVGVLELRRLYRSGSPTEAHDIATVLQATVTHAIAATRINGNDYQNWISLATLYQSLAGAGVADADDSARAAYQRASELNPTNPRILAGLAQLDMSQKKFTEALDYIGKSLALKPDFSAAYLLRSQVEAQMGSFSDALKDGAQAAALAPSDPFASYNLGALYYAHGDYALAIPALQKAVQLQRDYANALFVLGLAYERSGRTAEALQALRAVAALNPSDTIAAQALSQIERGVPVTATSTPSGTAL